MFDNLFIFLTEVSQFSTFFSPPFSTSFSPLSTEPWLVFIIFCYDSVIFQQERRKVDESHKLCWQTTQCKGAKASQKGRKYVEFIIKSFVIKT